MIDNKSNNTKTKEKQEKFLENFQKFYQNVYECVYFEKKLYKKDQLFCQKIQDSAEKLIDECLDKGKTYPPALIKARIFQNICRAKKEFFEMKDEYKNMYSNDVREKLHTIQDLTKEME